MTFSPPAIEPLSRLQVSQGLLITTDRWKHAQTYHRQRQNLHYQSLHQPGIVRGFGVCVIPPPAWAKGAELNHLWVRIAPGIAIDIQGNPIILETPREFGIDPRKLDLTQNEPHVVYLAAQYVDLEGDLDSSLFQTTDSQTTNFRTTNFQADGSTALDTSASDTVSTDKVIEPCRFVQRSYGKLQLADVELCRVRLQPGHLQLRTATSVHYPEANALDFRYRLTAKARPQCTVQVGHIYGDDDARAITQTALSTLLQSTAHLSSLVQGQPSLCEISCEQLNASPPNRHSLGRQLSKRQENDDPILHALHNCHLITVQHADLLELSPGGQKRLKHYMQQGGVILIEADADTLPLEAMKRQIESALGTIDRDEENQTWSEEEQQEWVDLRSQLGKSLAKVNAKIEQSIHSICEDVKNFARQIDYAAMGSGHIETTHPLKTSPFSFSNGPSLDHRPVKLFCWEGIVLIFGNLSDPWQIDQNSEMPRDNRAAQEWGLNLMHYAYKHHQLTQLQQWEASHE